MTTIAIIAGIAFIASCVVATADHRYQKKLLMQQRNAKELWRSEAQQKAREISKLEGDLTDRNNAITDLQRKIVELTSKRNMRGEFAAKHEEL